MDRRQPTGRVAALHHAWDNRDITEEEWTHHLDTPEVRSQIDAMLAGAEKRAQQPSQVDIPADIQRRCDELRQRINHDTAAAAVNSEGDGA